MNARPWHGFKKQSTNAWICPHVCPMLSGLWGGKKNMHTWCSKEVMMEDQETKLNTTWGAAIYSRGMQRQKQGKDRQRQRLTWLLPKGGRTTPLLWLGLSALSKLSNYRKEGTRGGDERYVKEERTIKRVTKIWTNRNRDAAAIRNLRQRKFRSDEGI